MAAAHWYQFLFKALMFHLKWAAAIVVAAYGGKARYRTAFLAVLGILRDKGKRVDSGKYDGRMSACRICPVYYAPLATCGSPLRQELRDVGCFCYMPAKGKYAAAECWLDEEGIESEFGWRAAGVN